MNDSYGKLSSEFYDAEKGFAEELETDFFASWIERAPGPALEAMCGSGRLMLPLLRRGFRVDGVDDSGPMLENLRARIGEAGLAEPKIYRQSIVDLDLPERYGLIFIALGSFQLLPKEVLDRVLVGLRRHLVPGGWLLLDTFLPWELIENRRELVMSVRSASGPGGLIQLRSETTIVRGSQYYVWKNTYRRGEEVEYETLRVNWYFPSDLAPRLEAAGFDAVVRPLPVASPQPRRYLYEAAASTKIGSNTR